MKLHVLAIAAHPDDVEMSCGGTMALHARKGQLTGIVDLTRGELGTRGTPEIRMQEAEAAAKILGVATRENAGFADGFFRNDEEHQRRLIRYIRTYRPEIVLTNAPEDRHPDHGRGAALVADACFLAGLRMIATLGDDGVQQEAWRPKRLFHFIQDRQLEPTFIVDTTETFGQKMESIKAYKSQFHDPESKEPVSYIATESFLNQLEYRDVLMGKRIGAEYGEGFISVNAPGLRDLDALRLPAIS